MTLPHENASQFLVKALTSGDDAVVIWHDPSGDAREAFEDFELEGVEKLDEADFGAFELKCKLNELAGTRPILLYRQHHRVDTSEEIRRDYLADVEQYATHYEADLESELLRELNATDTPAMRQLLNSCKGYLKKRQVRKLQNLRQSYATADALTMAIIATILGTKDTTPYELVISYLAADDEAAEKAVKTMEGAHLLDDFARVVREGTSYSGDIQDRELLTTSILFTALLVSLRKEDLPGYERYLLGSSAQDASVRSCHRIVTEWAEGPARAELQEICERVAEDECLTPALEGLGAERLGSTGVFPQIDDIVICDLLEGLKAGVMSPAEAQAVLDKRKGQLWYAMSEERYEAVRWYAALANLAVSLKDTLHFRSAKEAWTRYEDELCEVDTAYRKARPLLERLKIHAEGEALENAADAALERVENLYASFIDCLAQAWSNTAESNYESTGYAADIDRSNGFYLRVVEPLVHAGGCVIIISDALRYEVAKELTALLNPEFSGDVELSSMQAPYPSITTTGMAALLPHSTYNLELKGAGAAQRASLAATVDDLPTVSSAQREAVLQKAEAGARVFRATDYQQLSAQDRKALRKESKLVYIYQNVIDAMGDSAKTEAHALEACDDAIEQLRDLIRAVARDRQHIVITSDHGFLFTRRKLAEYEKAERATESGEVLWADRRALLAGQGSGASGLIEVNMRTNGAPELVGFSPRDCSRFKMPGGGANYVHGGTSLQEVCVPVIKLRKRRKGSRGYEEVEPVRLQPVGLPSVITNNVLTLRFLQEEPVGGQWKAANYALAFVDAKGALLSERKRIVADKDAADPRAREFTLEFILSAGSHVRLGDTCYLVQTDMDARDREVARWPLTYQVAFAPPSDFGW